MMKRIFWIVLFFLGILLQNVQAQVILRKVNAIFTKAYVEAYPESNYHVFLDTAFTSVLVRIPKNQKVDELQLVVGNRTIDLSHDAHHDTETEWGSQLIIFAKPTEEVVFLSNEFIGRAELQFFNAAEKKSVVKKKDLSIKLRTSSLCPEPYSVPQSDWRLGLPDPIGVRSGTKVSHVVVHHSAGSNLAGDYEAEVRNIYLLHTQSDKFDDIGYNYLIDPEGIIYKGRDGQGVAEQDNVAGAHMCNKNEGTMGVCLLGTFTDVLPTAKALHALAFLTGWKLAKEGLDAHSGSIHSIGPTTANNPDAFLPVVAGHRDGCTPGYTECPGQKVYEYLPVLRDSVTRYSIACAILGNSYHLVTSPSESVNITITDLTGTLVRVCHSNEEAQKTVLVPGMYIFRYTTSREKYSRKIFVN